MTTPRHLFDWITRAEDALIRLADNPWTLFLVLVCINTLAHPYAGITHDSRLYSVQVLNYVEDGTYADDLFFRYGSQDQYSLFSRVVGPLVHVFGLPTAFFLIYLVSKSILIFGMMRLVLTLVPNRVAAVLALMFAMAATIHYGGQHLLTVQENFLTARTLACGLVLLGLDWLLRGRPILSLTSIVFAAAIHPLMAFGGLLIWAGFHLWKYLGVKVFVGATVLATALAAVVLAIEPIGTRVFGPMDDLWRQTIISASSFNFPSHWARDDWYYLAFQLAILGIVIWKYRSLDGVKARFLIVLLFVTFAGSIGAVLAEELPYALFLQGQPYRALWMLAFLHIAFVFWLWIEWSRQSSWLAQLAGCALLAYLCCVNALADEFVLAALLFPIMALGLRGLEKEPRYPGWLVHSIQMSLVLGAVGWAAYKVVLVLRGYEEILLKYHEHRDLVEVVLLNLGPIVFLLGACWFLVRFMDTRWSRPMGYALTAAFCLAVQTFYFAFPQTDFYREHSDRYRADLNTVRAMIHRDRTPGSAGGGLPTVYSNLGCLDYVWLDLRAQCYFDWWQAGNYMFRRDMAMEGRRRAQLVAPFALNRYHQFEDQLSPGSKEAIGRFFQTDFHCGPLGPNDFARLCQEPGLDYLVLGESVEGVPAVQVGRLYLYSCKDVRMALGLPEPSACIRMAACER